MNPADRASTQQRTLIQAIMIAVLLWGGYLAIGAMRAPGNHAGWRGLIIFGCTLGFLGLWLAALALRRRRLKS